MKALFNLKYLPQYQYIMEDQLQVEYQSYLSICQERRHFIRQSPAYEQISTCMWLNFDMWLDYMEYIVY